MLKLILEKYLQTVKRVRFLIKYKAKDKRAVNDWFPGEKWCFGKDATIS